MAYPQSAFAAEPFGPQPFPWAGCLHGASAIPGLLCQSLSSEGALRFYTQTTARGRCLWRRAHRLKQYTKTGLGSRCSDIPLDCPERLAGFGCIMVSDWVVCCASPYHRGGGLRFYTQTTARGRCLWRRAGGATSPCESSKRERRTARTRSVPATSNE